MMIWYPRKLLLSSMVISRCPASLQATDIDLCLPLLMPHFTSLSNHTNYVQLGRDTGSRIAR